LTSFNAIVWHGTQTSRDLIHENEFYFDGLSKTMAKTNNVYKFEVILTTFEVLLQDVELLSKPFWKYLVIDEAHRLKVKKYLGDFKIVQILTANIEQAISIVRDFAKLPQRASFVVDRHAFAKQY
jgi:SNF2 family DNA or RNA helicase